MFLVSGLALVGILTAGGDLEPTPELAPILTTGALEDCLGERVAVVQSAVFVDLHVPGPAGAAATGELGERLVRGRLDGSGPMLEGACRDGSPVALVARFAGNGGLEVEGPDGLVRLLAVGAETALEGVAQAKGAKLISRMLLAVAVVVAAARLVGALFTRLRQPQVIGEIVAGILLGPSLLGLVAPAAVDYLFPPAVVDVMSVMAQFGLVLFMFLIGLELDHSLLRGSGHTAVFVSHVSILAPLVMGAGLAYWMFPLVGSGRFAGFALFVGAAMAITAFPVLARILTDSGLANSRLGALAITCAAVDDVTAWCVLAVVVAIAKAGGIGEALFTIGLAVVFIALMILVVRPLLQRLEWAHARRGRLGAHLTAAILVGLFASAWATEMIGIHAIFGAFLAGAVLPRSGPLAKALTERLEDLTLLFLLPIFFAVVGLSTSIGLLDQPIHWAIAGAVFATAVLGKWAAGSVAARVAGEPWQISNALGILMNTRGLAEIVILTVGRELGLITPALFAAMVLMALGTTFMTTPLLRLFYKPEEVPIRAEGVIDLPASTARLMVAVGDPATADGLVEIAGEIARGLPESAVVLARVVEPVGDDLLRSIAGEQETIQHVERELRDLAERVDLLGPPARVLVVAADDRAESLANLAEQIGADLVVMGMHRSVFGTRALGGVVGSLLDRLECGMVVLVGHGSVGEDRFRNPAGSIVAVGADPDGPVFEIARLLAKATGVPVVRVAQVDLAVPIRLVVAGFDDPGLDRLIRTADVPVLVVRRPGVRFPSLPTEQSAADGGRVFD